MHMQRYIHTLYFSLSLSLSHTHTLTPTRLPTHTLLRARTHVSAHADTWCADTCTSTLTRMCVLVAGISMSSACGENGAAALGPVYGGSCRVGEACKRADGCARQTIFGVIPLSRGAMPLLLAVVPCLLGGLVLVVISLGLEAFLKT